MTQLPPITTALPSVESPGLLGRGVPQDNFRARFDEEHQLIKALGRQVDAVYAGDSLTASCPFQTLLADLFPIGLNRGVGGDSAHWFPKRLLADVTQLQPRLISFMIGTNDIAHRFGHEDDTKILADYTANMTVILDAFSACGATCLIGTIPPSVPMFLEQPFNDSQVRMQARKAALIPQMNAAVCKLVEERSMQLVDYHAAMLTPEGIPDTTLYSDHCHFNAAGKLRMAQALRQVAEDRVIEQR
ncbi:MAG: SGNH/GDSL hydrolase family protein [Opitutales bacterium]